MDPKVAAKYFIAFFSGIAFGILSFWLGFYLYDVMYDWVHLDEYVWVLYIFLFMSLVEILIFRFYGKSSFKSIVLCLVLLFIGGLFPVVGYFIKAINDLKNFSL